MKKVCCWAVIALSMLVTPCLRATAMGDADVQVNISLPIPPLMFPAPPPLLPIPGAYVYYPPDVTVDIFFYHDHWYRPHGGKWYQAENYNGPWHPIHHRQVPRAVAGIPPSYRTFAHHHQKIPYHQVQRHHRTWEKDRHWDRHRKRSHGGKDLRRKDKEKHGQYQDDHRKPDKHHRKDR